MTAPRYDRTITASASGGPFAAGRPAFIVIHSTEGPMSDGNAVALAQWFAKSPSAGGPGTSATGIFDPAGSVRMLPEQTIPYHCGPAGNPLSVGDEHCGSVNLTPAQWMSPRGQAMLDASAKVQAQRAHFRGWSLAECRWLTLTQVAARTVHGFASHNDVRLALGGTTHSDPGPNFPYAWYMGRIRAWYQNPDGAPTTDEDGMMAFDDQDSANLAALGGIAKALGTSTYSKGLSGAGDVLPAIYANLHGLTGLDEQVAELDGHVVELRDAVAGLPDKIGTAVATALKAVTPVPPAPGA